MLICNDINIYEIEPIYNGWKVDQHTLKIVKGGLGSIEDVKEWIEKHGEVGVNYTYMNVITKHKG